MKYGRTKILIVMAMVMTTAVSCTIQKRQHLGGCHTQWFTNHSKTTGVAFSSETKKMKAINTSDSFLELEHIGGSINMELRSLIPVAE